MVLFIESKPQDIVETEMQSLSLNNGQKTSDAHFTRVSEVSLCLLALLWL